MSARQLPLPFSTRWVAPRPPTRVATAARRAAALTRQLRRRHGIAPPHGDCARILVVGRQAFACLTATQQQHFFADKPIKQVGSGLYATVYRHKDPDKVVKITGDKSDVTSLLRAQGLDRIPTVYESRRLASATCWKPSWQAQQWPPATRRWRSPDVTDCRKHGPQLFAVVVERLKPLSRKAVRFWDRPVACIAGNSAVMRTPDLIFKCCPGARSKTCRKLARDLPRIISDLDDRGIHWMDVHSGNIGLDKYGRWMVLDLGVTGTRSAALPTLRGRR